MRRLPIAICRPLQSADGKIVYHEFNEAESQQLLDAAKDEVASADA